MMCRRVLKDACKVLKDAYSKGGKAYIKKSRQTGKFSGLSVLCPKIPGGDRKMKKDIV